MNAVAARELFLAQRRAYIGGTDIAAIVGVSNWASPLSVYLDKTAPEKSDDKDSLPMRRGLALERFIADEFERAKPGTVCYHPAPVVRTDWGFPAGASVDRYVATTEHPRTPTAILECKTAFSYPAGLAWQAPDPGKGAGEGDLPDAYYTQVQWYLAVTGLGWAYGAADTGRSELTIVPIRANERVQARLIEAGRAFWTEHVLAGVPPAPIGTDADAEALARLWPDTVPDPPVTIEDELAELILSDYLAHSVKAKEHEEQAKAAKQQLQALMGENEQAVVGSWRLTWKKQQRTTVDTKRLKAERPEVAAEYSRTSESRVFGTPKEITP
jgi:putative phage-type endonuclease